MEIKPTDNMIITALAEPKENKEKIKYIKNKLEEIIPSFCKTIETFSEMYFNEDDPWADDFTIEYLMQSWVKNAKLENIDALFRNLGIKCKFEPVGTPDRHFVYDSSDEYHADNALIKNLEDITTVEDAVRYFNYIFEYADRFNSLLCNINNIPIKYPTMQTLAITTDIIPLKNIMNYLIISLLDLQKYIT